MFLGSVSSDISVRTRKWRPSVNCVRGIICRHRDHIGRDLASRNGIDVRCTHVYRLLTLRHSRDPTVGAQYRWSATFAPRYNRFFGLMQGRFIFLLVIYILMVLGWITSFAWICSCTSNPALLANIIVSLANFNKLAYVPQRWHVTLMMWAITLVPCVGNFWFRRILKPIEAIGAFLLVSSFVVSIITLLVMAEKSSASYVFNTLTHGPSGWENPAVAWGIGLLTMAFPLTGMPLDFHCVYF